MENCQSAVKGGVCRGSNAQAFGPAAGLFQFSIKPLKTNCFEKNYYIKNNQRIKLYEMI